MPRFSLDSLTLTNVSPMEIIKAADGAGFDFVSLWVQPPHVYPLPLVCGENERECARALEDTGMRVGALEVFDLHSLAAVETYRDAFERGARLGGQTAVAINLSNPDRNYVADVLAHMADVAREYGLSVNLEPIVGGQTSTLAQGADLIARSRAQVGLVFDAWHLIGGGGCAADIEGIDTSLIGYVQLCDGALPMLPERIGPDTVQERLYPGDGAFSLVEMLRVLPQDVTFAVECPSRSRARAGVSPKEQAREALAAMKAVVAWQNA